jgi:amidohydrolase
MYRKIEELTQKYNPKVVEWRRAIHSHPELSAQEEKTAALVAEVLAGLGLDVKKNVGGHGVVGLLKGGKGAGKVVALRADMDALPLQEDTGLPFASAVPNVMHACGHDTHTAMLMGTACVLSEMKDELEGSVKFIFQPAEELNPIGGAPGMIKDGVLEDPHVDALFALHVWPSFETGTVISRPGPMMGASDRFYITVTGKAAHGSAPHQGTDAIMIACQIVGGLQTIVSRMMPPLEPVVVGVGTISPATQEILPGLMERAAVGYARALGGDAEVKYVRGYPPTKNAPELFDFVSGVVAASLGEGHFATLENPDLGGEAFSYFANERPALMAWLGCRPAGMSPKEMSVLHNSHFAPDENCFPYGVRFMASCAVDYRKK